MTLPPVARIFFAIDLSPAVKSTLRDFISSLKKKSRSRAIRWTKSENLHITLQFLAEVQTAHLPKLIEEVRAHIASTLQGTMFTFDKIHLYPSPYRPRVIVLEVSPQEELALLAQSIGEGIKAVNYPIESRPFRGHLTLGRIKQPQGMDFHFLADVPLPTVEPISVNEVILFRSEPGSDGSKYTVLERITLFSPELQPMK